MIEGIEFSDRGDALTEFEVKLLSTAKSDSPWVCVAQRLFRELGATAGSAALAVILDELGGEKVYVTPRRSFFERLWGIERDALICVLAIRRDDWNFAEIARHLGVSREYVRKVVAGKTQPAGPTAPPAP